MWLWLSAAAMVTTAAIHSAAGERKLVGPLLRGDQPPMDNAQSRKVLRSAWHITSAFMILSAIVVAWPGLPAALIVAIGIFWLCLGLLSLISSRGRHVGWPSLLASGTFALLGASS